MNRLLHLAFTTSCSVALLQSRFGLRTTSANSDNTSHIDYEVIDRPEI